jgi:hypothetical protein
MNENATQELTPTTCPTCGQNVLKVTDHDGTERFENPPVLSTIFGALKAKGWTVAPGKYTDPEGNHWGSLEDAVMAQSMREIAEA